MDETNELQDSQTPDDNADVEQAPQDDSVNSAELVEKNKQLFARAKKAEEELKELRSKPESIKQEVSSQPDEIDTVLQLRTEGFTDEEIRELRGQAKKFGVGVSEVVSNPLIKEGIEARRAKRQVEQNTPPPSSRTSTEEVVNTFRETKPEERAQKYSYEAWKSRKK